MQLNLKRISIQYFIFITNVIYNVEIKTANSYNLTHMKHTYTNMQE